MSENTESARRFADKMRRGAAKGMPGTGATWIEGLADDLEVAEARVAALTQVAEAARNIRGWIVLPSDVYPQHRERLREVRTNLDDSLAALDAPLEVKA